MNCRRLNAAIPPAARVSEGDYSKNIQMHIAGHSRRLCLLRQRDAQHNLDTLSEPYLKLIPLYS